MAVSNERWFCGELEKLGIEATEDNARYILSMDSADDLEEYMLEILDGSDPNVRLFLQELRNRFAPSGQKAAVQVYQKNKAPEDYSTGTGKSKKKKKKEEVNNILPDAVTSRPLTNGGLHAIASELNNIESSLPLATSSQLGVGAKKKSKFVPLYSKEGQSKAVIQLPGRYMCECQAAKHKLINNCMSCGRIVCEQEGAGPCVHCGALVCTPEDQEFIAKGSKKSEKFRQSLMMRDGSRNGGEEHTTSQSHLPHMSRQGMEKALKHRDKLLEYDRTSVRRTQVIDDECDYYSTDSNQWLSKGDREKLRKREEELRSARHGSRRDRKITFDFAGRRVVDAEEDTAKKMYSMEDQVIQEVHYGQGGQSNSRAVNLINPTIQLDPPKFVENSIVGWGPAHSTTNAVPGGKLDLTKSSSRIQDRELQEMSDEGMCLSMHQPWASLLVCGIKMHEGRTWYTPHRGRLWIAATAKTPTTEDIAELEQAYRYVLENPDLAFPKEYPSGCLLGCVNVDDCLDQDEYRRKFPDGGESASPYVFMCSNPQQLVVKFPMKGKHKIYKLEPHIHQGAKKGLR